MKRRISLLICMFTAASLAAAGGCGGSHGACGVQPCGGDVVGNWQASSACANRAELNQEFLAGIMGYCEGATLGAVSTKPTGLMTFAADQTYSASLSMNATVGVNVPASCLSGTSCAALTVLLQTALVGTSGIQSASCMGSGSCTCTLNVVAAIEDSSGTYATAGTVLTLYATAGTATGGGGDYCVKDTTLHLLTVDTSMPMATITSDIVLRK
jgi:hypothetical protein